MHLLSLCLIGVALGAVELSPRGSSTAAPAAAKPDPAITILDALYRELPWTTHEHIDAFYKGWDGSADAMRQFITNLNGLKTAVLPREETCTDNRLKRGLLLAMLGPTPQGSRMALEILGLIKCAAVAEWIETIGSYEFLAHSHGKRCILLRQFEASAKKLGVLKVAGGTYRLMAWQNLLWAMQKGDASVRASFEELFDDYLYPEARSYLEDDDAGDAEKTLQLVNVSRLLGRAMSRDALCLFGLRFFQQHPKLLARGHAKGFDY